MRHTVWITPGLSSVRTSSTVACARRLGAYGDASAPAAPAYGGRSRAVGVEPAVDDVLQPLPEHARVELGLGDLPLRDADVVDGPRPGGPHRDPLQREHRGGVGEQPDPVAGARP